MSLGDVLLTTPVGTNTGRNMKDPKSDDKDGVRLETDHQALARDDKEYSADSGDAVALKIRPDGTVVLPDGRVEQWLPKNEKP